MIENAKQAHAAGRVWVTIKINGGPVKAPGGRPIGKVELTGPFTAEHALDIFKVATRDE